MQFSTFNIQVSDKALAELQRLGVGAKNFLRIQVVPGGCSGMTYSASVDTTLKEGDEVIYRHEDLRIVSDSGSLIFLDGLHVDFSDDLVQAGFRFRNPNAARSCGCGSSFGT